MEIDCARYSVVVLLDWLVFCVLCGSCFVCNTFHVLLPITKQTFATWVYRLVARVLKMYFIQRTLNAMVVWREMFGEIPNKPKCLYRWINILKAIISHCVCEWFFFSHRLVQYQKRMETKFRCASYQTCDMEYIPDVTLYTIWHHTLALRSIAKINKEMNLKRLRYSECSVVTIYTVYSNRNGALITSCWSNRKLLVKIDATDTHLIVWESKFESVCRRCNHHYYLIIFIDPLGTQIWSIY